MSYIDKKYLFRCETCRHSRRGVCSVFCESGECYTPSLAKIPTADIVDVVKCNDCKFSTGDRKYSVLECNHPHGLYMPKPTDFCSFGVRKGEPHK